MTSIYHPRTAPELDLTPGEATPITGVLTWTTDGETVTYFAQLEFITQHRHGDTNAMKKQAARFYHHNHVSIRDLVASLTLSRSTIVRAIRQWQEQGEESFDTPRTSAGRGRSAVTAAQAEQATALLAQGLSGRQCAAELGIATSTFNDNLRAGVIPLPTDDPPPVSEPSARSQADRQPAAGRACHDSERRQLAAVGLLDAAVPRFDEPARAVTHGGVLTALPMLLKEGLLSATHGLLKLPAGFYGLSTILLMLAFLTLTRTRSFEALRHQSPGEWGRLLGLDRGPEVKTLRSKIKALCAAPETLQQWHDRLARQWFAGVADEWLTVAVDGHVKVYSGRRGRLPKHFVSRQKVCLPASVSYWVNALNGAPLICIHKELDPKLVQVLEHDVLPALRRLGVVPTTGDRHSAPAATLVFDREGWSPDLFVRLAAQGVACITWHKNHQGADWPVTDFKPCAVPLYGPVHTTTHTILLAEQPLRLRNGLAVRQLRRLMPDGRQMPLITTHPSMPATQVAGAMMSRWNQENYFKYMKQHFHLDTLTEHTLAPVHLDQLVVDPGYRDLQRTIDRQRKLLHRRQVQAARRPADDLTDDLQHLQTTLDQLLEQRRSRPRKVRVGDLPVDQQPQALPWPTRLFLDTIRSLCYRAETAMMNSLTADGPPRGDERTRLAALMQTDANLIPEPHHRQLRVQLLGLGSHGVDESFQPLLEALNRTATVYPGTDWRMVYELLR